MKKSIYSICSVVLLSAPCAIAQDKPLEAKLVTISISSGLPSNIGFMDKPQGYQEGATLSFFIQGENMVAIDEDSLKADGWKLDFGDRVSENGKSASFRIKNKKITKAEEIKLAGSIDILLGQKTETKTAALKDGEVIKFKAFTASLNIKEKGIDVVGDHPSIKSIKLKSDGKLLESNGTSWSGKNKTYYFRSVKDGAEVTIEYYTDLKKQTVKFSK